MSDSVRPHRRQPTRLPCPWYSTVKNTGVGCHVLLQCMKVKSESEVTQLCPTLSDPMDCSLPGSSFHGIFQARVLEWGAIAFSLHIWGYWYFSRQSWFQLVFLPVQHFSWCTLHSTSKKVLSFSYLVPASTRVLAGENSSPRKGILREFCGGPVAKTPCSQCRGARFNPCLGNQIPHATTKSSHTTTKDHFHVPAGLKILHTTTNTWHSQTNT